jgi:hypothetical protein
MNANADVDAERVIDSDRDSDSDKAYRRVFVDALRGNVHELLKHNPCTYETHEHDDTFRRVDGEVLRTCRYMEENSIPIPLFWFNVNVPLRRLCWRGNTQRTRTKGHAISLEFTMILDV